VPDRQRESRRNPSDPGIAARLPPGQSITYKWPVLHAGEVPRIDLGTWRLRAFGAVEEEASWTWTEFLALPQVEIVSDIHCVTRWSRFENRWEGVSTRELLGRTRLRPSARYVLVHAYGDYTANLPLEAFSAENALLAHRHDGEPLAPEHGGPVRLVVPALYFWKSAKWIHGLEFLEKDRLGFWERNGYHENGDPWKEQRYGGIRSR
jgi:DMSO/TMAO reductase YedYZ molybdopterin-dependent catalytic subunit